MIAYTAWDSLQAIARQYDADLSIDAEAHVALTPHWDRLMRSRPVRGLYDWSRRRLTTPHATPESRT
jgi:hypothetical protein